MKNVYKYQTKDLFISLIKALKPDLICDIGSRDGREALTFKEVCPTAKLVAFEANPFLYKLLKNNLHFVEKVELKNQAVSNKNGKSSFYLTKEDFESSPNSVDAGRSSLMNSDSEKEKIEVETIRLDDLFQEANYKNIFLWIDVEGHAFEVIEGIEKIKDSVKCIHVELENKVYWKGQKIKVEVVELLKSYGFFPLFDNLTKKEGQADVIFIHNSVYTKNIKRIKKQANLWRNFTYPFKLIGLDKLKFISKFANKLRYNYLVP